MKRNTHRCWGLAWAFVGLIMLTGSVIYASTYPLADHTGIEKEVSGFIKVAYACGEFLICSFMGAGIFLLGALLTGFGASHLFEPKEGMRNRILLSICISLAFSVTAALVPAPFDTCFTGGYGGALPSLLATRISQGPGSLTALCVCLILMIVTVVYIMRSAIFSPHVEEEKEFEEEVKPKRETRPKKEPKSKAKSEIPTPSVGDIDPKSELAKYQQPSTTILEKYTERIFATPKSEIEERKGIILETLNDYKVQLDKIEAIPGPTVTLFKLFPAKKVTVQSILGRDKELKIALKTLKMNMDQMADAIGLAVPNEKRSIVPLKSIIESDAFRNFSGALPVAVGYTIDMKPKVIDLAKAPHLLIAGTTGGGKSVSMHSIIMSILYSKHPSEVKMVLIDPKRGTEFGCYRPLADHYLALLPEAGSEQEEQDRSIVVNRKAADKTLRALRQDMDERYELFDKAGVSKIDEYNTKYCGKKLLPTEGHKFLPYIVVIIDEFGDLIQKGKNREETELGRNINSTLIGLSALGRAAGIHLVVATQSPKAEVITTQIKNNFPWQMALMCKDYTQSRVIIDTAGAEQLIGNGDMLLCTEKRQERVQGAFVDKPEIFKTVKAIAAQKGFQKSPSVPFYLPEVPDNENEDKKGSNVDMTKLDARFEEAARYVVTNQIASTSDLQANLGLGFPRARKIMSQMEAAGIVGPQNGSKPREVMIETTAELLELLQKM